MIKCVASHIENRSWNVVRNCTWWSKKCIFIYTSSSLRSVLSAKNTKELNVYTSTIYKICVEFAAICIIRRRNAKSGSVVKPGRTVIWCWSWTYKINKNSKKGVNIMIYAINVMAGKSLITILTFIKPGYAKTIIEIKTMSVLIIIITRTKGKSPIWSNIYIAKTSPNLYNPSISHPIYTYNNHTNNT